MPVVPSSLPALLLCHAGRQWSPWWVQRAIALAATAVLFFLLLLQTINITVLLPVIVDRMAYTWIMVIQFVSVCLMAVMQVGGVG